MKQKRTTGILRGICAAPCWRSPFVRGVLFGGILVGLLFLSWKLVLMAVGILLLLFLLWRWN